MNINELSAIALSQLKKGKLQEAEASYRQILEIRPDDVNALHFLGVVYYRLRRYDLAIRYIHKALLVQPNYVDAYSNLGLVLQETGRFDEAAACYEKSIAVNPGFFYAYHNLGNLNRENNEVEKAINYYQKALQINPLFEPAHSNLLLYMCHSSRYDIHTIFAEHKHFAELHEKPSSFAFKNYDLITDRILRIGYVSPDFRRHSVAYFIEPVIMAHDKEQFEIFCYSTVDIEDDVTERLKKQAVCWRNISEMSDAQATECIQSDKIDILVDLAGHTANNRLLLFAQKPVPIQVNWIGYPATSGLSAMDYRIVDRYTDPPGLTEQFYSEVLMRLPESFICYLPEICSPEVDRLPALFTGHITFGSFNNVNKMSPEVSEAWIDILKAVENSHFVIKSKGLNIPKVRDNIMKVFRQGGISDQRITLLAELPSTREHLDVYNSIDISLDTFPYNGTTTTCESLWMGVPVITLTGTAYAARVGTSILSNVGLPELIAGTADEYKSIAVNLAGDPERLQSLRGNLRTLMTRSPLCNAERFTANVEICYRKMWENWCTACR